MPISETLLELLICPVCRGKVILKEDGTRPEVPGLQPCLPGTRRHPNHAARRSQNRAIKHVTVLEQLPEGSRVAIIRLRSLGDCVLTTPAIHLLRQTRKDLQIGMAVEKRFASVFEANPDVSQVLDAAWRPVMGWKPALCLNLHGGSRSQWITALSGAKWRAGFAHHNFTFAYNLKIPRAQRILGLNRTVHTAEHLASAVFSLGVPLQPIPRACLFAPASPVPGVTPFFMPSPPPPANNGPLNASAKWRVT